MSQLDRRDASAKADLDVELGLDLDSDTDWEDDSPKSWHKSPLHVRRIKRRDGRPVSADVNYDQTSRKLVIYTYSANHGKYAKVRRRVPEADSYLRRQSTPEILRRNYLSDVVGMRAMELSIVGEFSEGERDRKTRPSSEGCDAPEDEDGGNVYPILPWGDLRNHGNMGKVAAERCSFLHRQAGDMREIVTTPYDEFEESGKQSLKKTDNPAQDRQINDRSLGVKGIGGFNTLDNRGGNWEGCGNGNVQLLPRTRSSLPSVVVSNEVQFRSQEDIRRIWPAQIEWRISEEDGERNTNRNFTHKIPEIGMKSAQHSEATERKRSPSFLHEAPFQRLFSKQNVKSPTINDEFRRSEETEESLGGVKVEGSCRLRWDSCDIDAKPSIAKTVPLAIEIPDEYPAHQPAKELNQETETVQRSATKYIKFRHPEVIREGLVLQSSFIGTGVSRNLRVFGNNRIDENTQTCDNSSYEDLSTTQDGSNVDRKQSKDSLLVFRRKPFEFQNLHQSFYGSLRETGSDDSGQGCARSPEDNASTNVSISGSPALPQSSQVRLAKTTTSKPQNGEQTNVNEHIITSRVRSHTSINLPESDTCSDSFLSASPRINDNIPGCSDTSHHLGEEKTLVESTLRVLRESQDGLESKHSTYSRHFQDRRQSESNVQECPAKDDCQGESLRNYGPLPDRSCSVPSIIQNCPPPKNVCRNESDIHHRPVQNSFSLSNCNQLFENTWASESSLRPQTLDLPTSLNTLASSHTTRDSSFKDGKSPESRRSFVHSAENLALKNQRMTVPPKCSLREVPAENRTSTQHQNEKTQRSSLPLIFYNTKYQYPETIDPVAKFDREESDKWRQFIGTGDTWWHSLADIPEQIEVKQPEEHESANCRQDMTLGDTDMAHKKPPKPTLEMTIQTQPGDWHYNNIYEPGTPSSLDEVLPTIKENIQTVVHSDYDAITGQPANQWNSLPSIFGSEDHRDPAGTFHKSTSSEKIHSRIWTPTHRIQSPKTLAIRNQADENFPRTKTITDRSGSSLWVNLSEDATNSYHSGKHKTTYKRKIKQIPSFASKMYRNTKSQSETPAQHNQQDSSNHEAKTGLKENFTKDTEMTSAKPTDLIQGAKCSDSSFYKTSDMAKTRRERDLESAETAVEDATVKLNQQKRSLPSTSEEQGRNLKPGVVDRGTEQEDKVISACFRETEDQRERVQTETFLAENICSNLPVGPFSAEINWDSRSGTKLGSTEKATSALSTDQEHIMRGNRFTLDTKPIQDPSLSSHRPQIDLTTIKARVFRITQDNISAELSAALNQRDKDDHRKNLFTEIEKRDQAQNWDKETKTFQRHETIEKAKDNSNQTDKRLEDLRMHQTFREIDIELSKLTMADEPRSNSNNEQSVVQPLSIENLSLLDHSRPHEWRNTSLEYAKQWLESAVPCNTPPVEIENCSSCDENYSNEGSGLPDTLPKEMVGAGNKPCSYDADVIDSVLQNFAAHKSEHLYPESIGMREIARDCNAFDVVGGTSRPSKARSRDLLTESALSIPVAAPPTQLQIHPEDEKSIVRSRSLELIRVSLSRKQAPEKELKDGQRIFPKQSHKQNHDSISESIEGSTRPMAPAGTIHMRNRSISSSAVPKGEVETHKSSPSERVSTTWNEAACVATDETERRDKNETEKQGKISAGIEQLNNPLSRRQTSAGTNSEPADTTFFHEITLEWSPGKGNLLDTKAPEECCFCSRTARLPDNPSLKYYKLSHRCSRSNQQNGDSTTAHSKFLVNSRSELSLEELRNLTQFVSRRQGSSVPVQRYSRRSLSAIDAMINPKKGPISGGSTNASDPCPLTATILRKSSHKPASHCSPTRDAAGVRTSTHSKNEKDLSTQSSSCGEYHATSAAHKTASHAISCTENPTLKHKSLGQTSKLRPSVDSATRQKFMEHNLVKNGQRSPNTSHGSHLGLNPAGVVNTNTMYDIDSTEVISTSTAKTMQPQESLQDLSNTELTDNTDVSLDGFLRANQAGYYPADPREHSDTEVPFPTAELLMPLDVKLQNNHECNKNFTSDNPTEIKIRRLYEAQHGVGHKPELSHHRVNVNSDKKLGDVKLSVSNIATRKLEISGQSFAQIAIRKPKKENSSTPQCQPDIPALRGTGITIATKMELIVPSHDYKTVDDRTSGLWENESTYNFRLEKHLQRDSNETEPKTRTKKAIVASFDDLTSPLMKPMTGTKSTEANVKNQSTVHQTPPNTVLPSTFLSTGRVKYRQISHQISDLVPNYDLDAFANNSHPNQDKV